LLELGGTKVTKKFRHNGGRLTAVEMNLEQVVRYHGAKDAYSDSLITVNADLFKYPRMPQWLQTRPANLGAAL
jgi:hypothetical protein